MHRSQRALLLVTLAGLLVLGLSAPTNPSQMQLQHVANWPDLPEGWNFGQISGVDVDSQNQVYVFHRGPHPIMCFEADGKFVRSWGDGIIKTSHGLAVDADDNVWVTDMGAQVVIKFSPKGRVLMVLGQKDAPGETETQFNRPTHVAFGSGGEIYVADGYGNSRIVKFSKEGRYLKAWGTKGTGPGQFDTPHTVLVDNQERLIVGDRENYRIQIFDAEGKFLTQWAEAGSPWGLALSREGHFYMSDGHNERLSKLDLEGRVLATFGRSGRAAGEFRYAHHIALGTGGELYVSEIHNWRVSKFLLK